MPQTLTTTPVETQGTIPSSDFQAVERLETSGKRLDKAAIVACLQASIESFLAAKQLSRESLAEDLCGMSLANFSKLSNGLQGDVLGFIYEKLPGDIRDDFMDRTTELNRVDPFTQAIEQLIAACIRVVVASRGQSLPDRAVKMAKAQERMQDLERKRA